MITLADGAAMAGRVRALLVGIDDYMGDVPKLGGCVNDVEAMVDLLTALAGNRLDTPMVLRDHEATVDNVVAAFRQHLRDAGPEDVALFYFSGHGSHEPAPPEFWDVEPDKRNETLVCVDSRTASGRDLADKELATLVAEVAEGGAHVLIILDCCHSGSGVRGEENVAGQRVRQAPGDTRERSLQDYRVPVALPLPAGAAQRGLLGTATGGRYVLLAACEASQTAKEQPIGGHRRGVFTVSLEAALRNCGGRISYADLLSWTSTRVQGLAAAQIPQLEVVKDPDRNLVFLGGQVDRGRYHLLVHTSDGWKVDAGAVHGVPAPRAGEAVAYAVYAQGATAKQRTALESRLAKAIVTQVRPHDSLVQLDDAAVLDEESAYLAVPIAWPVSPIAVTILGEDPGVELLTSALTDQTDLALTELGAEIVVCVTTDGFELRRASDDRLVTQRVEGVTADSAARVVDHLLHVATWRRVRELANPNSQLSAQDIDIDIVGGEDSASGAIRLHQPADGSTYPTVSVSVRNKGAVPLFVGVLGLSSQFGITNLMSPSPGEWVQPAGQLAIHDGQPIPLEVPDKLHDLGVTEVTDYITVVVSTAAFDAGTLTQNELDVPIDRGPLPEALVASTLDSLLLRVCTRGFAKPIQGKIADWMAATRSIRTTRPAASTELGAAPVHVGSITITAPPGLQGAVRVTSVDAAARDVPGPVPAALRETSMPVSLTPTRGVGDDSSVLELTNLTGAATITPTSPLIVTVAESLAADEHLLAVAWDGTYWLPVGHTATRGHNTTDVAIIDLPSGASEDDVAAKDLVGSVKILFRKLVGRRLGLDYDWPRLAIATVDDRGDVTYDAAGVATAVAHANTVLLYIHGIIGDTRGQVRHGDLSGLHGDYDLVLAFDYENLDTTIEQSAQSLGERLADVGLGPQHGKQLDVVAHSLGGLVTRWFIEHGQGREVVSRAVFAGTPHHGSPWPQIQDWASAALGVGLNALAGPLLWPGVALAGLVGVIERVDNTLDQMRADSDFLQDLAASGDPGVPYTLLSGDRSVPADNATKSLLERLRLRATGTVTALAFFGQANDIAVTVTSATAVPKPRDPAPRVIRLDCDHMTYFSSPTGIAALRATLQE